MTIVEASHRFRDHLLVLDGEESAEPVVVGTTIIIPAHNEVETVGHVVAAVRSVIGEHDEVLVIDDGSTDGTGLVATAAGATVLRRPHRCGNGSAIKAGVRAAKGGKLLMLDADGQHDASQIPEMLALLDTYDLVVAARSPEHHASTGRRFANGFFNWMASKLTGHKIDDLTSGYRAMRTDVIREFLPLLPNQFSYPTTTTMASFRAGYTVKYIPTEVRRRPGKEKSKIHPVRDAMKFLTIMFKIITLFAPMRVFAPISAVPTVLAGLAVGVGLLTGNGGAVTPLLLLTAGLFLFCIGLVSEQISALRFERPSHYEPI